MSGALGAGGSYNVACRGIQIRVVRGGIRCDLAGGGGEMSVTCGVSRGTSPTDFRDERRLRIVEINVACGASK